MARINIPKNASEKIKLALAITAKHVADGANSPLKGLDMADFSAKTATADTEHKKSEKLKKDAETATQARDQVLGGDKAPEGTVEFYLRSARDVLGGINKGKEKKLGEWGFEVDDSPTPAKTKKPSA